ncbi:MAG: cytidine deaminase [Methanosaeta sp. PtaU1.Bin112]|nr:MAG: cytidine deaminase [Methanosaeta sp. PtaU1.Bin112]
MLMRPTWFFAVLVALMVIASGQAIAVAPSGSLNGADNTTTIRFVFDKDYGPFTYEDNGSVQGFELDLLNLIGKVEGFSVIAQPMIWADAQLFFQKGDADVIGGFIKTEERQKRYNFTESPHGSWDIMTFVRDDSGIKSAAMLRGKKVAAQKGSVSYSIVKNLTGVQLLAYDYEQECLLALQQGDVDAFVCGSSSTWFRIRQQNISGIRALATPWEMHSLYFGVRDRELKKSLDRGMEIITQDGRYDRLYRRWFVRELSESEISALVNASRESSLNAYAPYSGLAVGAAVLTDSGRIYTGCNIENALYGYSTSALKVAIFKAISEGDGNIRAAANFLPDARAIAPAADERQILFEFNRGTLVILGENGNYEIKMVSEIFPYAFEMRS